MKKQIAFSQCTGNNKESRSASPLLKRDKRPISKISSSDKSIAEQDCKSIKNSIQEKLKLLRSRIDDDCCKDVVLTDIECLDERENHRAINAHIDNLSKKATIRTLEVI